MSMQTIDAPTLKHWLDTNQALLVDVREPAEFASEHIPGATLLSLTHVKKSALPAVGDKKIVLQCKAGMRGGNACQKLLAEDPSMELYNLAGGIDAWQAAGFTIAKGTRRILPLDRQVQLTIGLILLTASFVGYFSTPQLFLLTGLIGGGLTIAGLTGFCGLARLLARMPWNQQA